jgi:hypothetical protein
MTCANFPSSPERAADCSEVSSSDGSLCSLSRLMPTAGACLACDFPVCPHGQTSEISTPSPEAATSLPGDSLVSRFRKPESDLEKMTPATCGHTPFAFYESQEHRWASSRMSLDFSAQDISGRSSVTWPKRGSMRNGACWEQTTWAPRIDASGCGFWPTETWMTPRTPTGGGQAVRSTPGGGLHKLEDQILARGASTPQTYPTPNAGDADGRYARCKSTDSLHKPDGRHAMPLSRLAMQWRTPRASDGEKGGPNQTDGGPSLSNQASHMPTPTANRRSGLQSHGKNAILGSLNPDWVELLMGWPLSWTALVPLDMIDLMGWLMRNREVFGEEDSRVPEDVRAVWEADGPQAIQGDAGEQSSVLSSKVLRAEVCERPDRDQPAGVALEGAAVPRDPVCGVWDDDGAARPPCRQGHHEPEPGEPSDALHPLPSVPSRYGQAAWANGSWEAGIARTAVGVPNRVDRLRALGNGQVPQCMAVAFTLLAREAGVLR